VTSHVVGRRSTLTAALQRGIVTVISTAAERRTRSTRRCLIVEGVDPMKAYRTLWLSTCGLVGAFGTAVAVEASPVALSVLIVAYGVIGSLLTFCLVGEFWELGTGGRLRLLARGALVAGTSAGAFIGYATLLGPGVLLLAAATLASSPYAVTTSHRWLRSVRTPSAAQLGAVTRALAYASPDSVQFLPPPELRDLSDEQLCRRWQASYRAAGRGSSAPQLIAAVAQRQMYLDELEHRNAAGFSAWLAAAPGEADNPLPYLTGNHVAAPAFDWDELTRGQD
jgi:hypothetical protein